MNKFYIAKTFCGEPVTLTLVKKKSYEDKEYDLYKVCKVEKR